MEKQQKNNIMIMSRSVSTSNAYEAYKKQQQKYPNCNVHFYLNGIFYNEENYDELKFLVDQTFYRYFVELRIVNKSSSEVKKLWCSQQSEHVVQDDNQITLEQLKGILNSTVHLNDALFLLMQFCLIKFQQGYAVLELDEMLSIIKKRFYLTAKGTENNLDQIKRKKAK